MNTSYITFINTVLALVAAVFAGISVLLARKYHKISLLHSKSENLQKFINASWLLLSEYETIANALHKSEQMKAKFTPDSQVERAIEKGLKELLALGQAVAISDLFSKDIQAQVTEIYSLLRGGLSKPSDLTEIKEKITHLQHLYDNGIATK